MNDALKKELLYFLNSSALKCDNLHHAIKEQHGYFEPCPIEIRIKKLIEQIIKL